MPWAVAAAAVAAGGSIYAAKKGSDAAKDAAKATQSNPINVTTPFGYTGFANGEATAHAAPNPFMNMFGGLGLSSLANAGAANSNPYNGANQALINAHADASVAAMPGSPEYNETLSRMRAIAAPEENRQNLRQNNEQFAMGTLGTTGGAERFRALQEAHGDADLKRQLTAQGITTDNAANRFNRALTTVNQGMSNQQQQFNIGSSSNANQLNMWSQLLQQMGVGIAAGGGQAPGAAVYAAQQAGNVPLAIAQAANNPAFTQALQGMFGGGGQPQSPSTPPYAPPANNANWSGPR